LVVGACGRVDDEVLVCCGVDELFWAFVRGEADVDGAVVGGFFPGLVALVVAALTGFSTSVSSSKQSTPVSRL